MGLQACTIAPGIFAFVLFFEVGSPYFRTLSQQTKQTNTQTKTFPQNCIKVFCEPWSKKEESCSGSNIIVWNMPNFNSQIVIPALTSEENETSRKRIILRKQEYSVLKVIPQCFFFFFLTVHFKTFFSGAGEEVPGPSV